MKIPRLSMITLGVSNLDQSTQFYEAVLETRPNTSYQGITFIQLPGAWIALYPLENLAKDISEQIKPIHNLFSGITLAHNTKTKEEVVAIFQRAESAGAHIIKKPQDTFWGGYSGYFSDPDGYHWEIAWGPMFEFTEQGDLKFKPTV